MPRQSLFTHATELRTLVLQPAGRGVDLTRRGGVQWLALPTRFIESTRGLFGDADSLARGLEMAEHDPRFARAAIFEIIENRMRDEDPPETKQTYDRLIAGGYSHEETMRLIGCVVTSEIFDLMSQMQPFNLERFVAGLAALPELPWADDEE